MRRYHASIVLFTLFAYLLTVGWGKVFDLCIGSDGHIAIELSWMGCPDEELGSAGGVAGTFSAGGGEISAADFASEVPCIDVCLLNAGFSSDSETSKLKVFAASIALPLFFLVLFLLLLRPAFPSLPRPPGPDGTLLQRRTVVLLN